jgi:hypothetical protein
MAAWLVQLRTRLLLPADASGQQEAATEADQLRGRLVALEVSALTETDPLLPMKVDPANARELVIGFAGRQPPFSGAGHAASGFRGSLIARRLVGQRWQSLPATVSLFG